MPLVPIAVPGDRAHLTARVSGLADRAAVGDKCEVPSLSLVGRRPSFESRTGRLVAAVADEFPATGDSRDMRVHGEQRAVCRHREDYVCGLGPHSGESHEGLTGSLGGEAQDASQVPFPAFEDFLRGRMDSRCFLFSQSGMPDRSRNPPFVSLPKHLRRDPAEGGAQPSEPSSLVRRRRALGEDGRHENLERRHESGPVLRRIAGLEDSHRAGVCAAVHGAVSPAAAERVCGLNRSRRSGPL